MVSKKILIAALLVVSISSFAQNQAQPEKKSHKHKKEKLSPEQKNQAVLDRMTKELNLDAKQQEQIKPIIAEQSAKNEAMKAEMKGKDPKQLTDEEREAFKQKRKADKEANENKLKAILTPEQFKKMEDNEAAVKSSFGQGKAQVEKKSQKHKKGKLSPEEKNQAVLDRMTKELNLDAKQQEQIKPIIAEQSAKNEAMKAGMKGKMPKDLTDEEREAFKQKRKEEKKANENKLKAILTPEQFKKMKENEAAAKEKMKEYKQSKPNREEREEE